jgi:hypothetical protein
MNEGAGFGQGEESGGLDLAQEADQIPVSVSVEHKHPLAVCPYHFVMPPRNVEAHHL